MTTPVIPEPNYTQTPNVIFDELLPSLGYAELKVLLWVTRQTAGWHTDWTNAKRSASLSATVKGTGISRHSVTAGYASLEARGLVEWRNGPDGHVEWRLKTTSDGGEATSPSANGVGKQVPQAREAGSLAVGKQVPPIKETETNVKEQGFPAAPDAAGAPLDAGLSPLDHGQAVRAASDQPGKPAKNGREPKPPRPARGGAAPRVPMGDGCQLYRDVLHRTPNDTQRPALDAAHARHGADRMREVLTWWSFNGWNPGSVPKILDALDRGSDLEPLGNGYARNGNGRAAPDFSQVIL